METFDAFPSLIGSKSASAILGIDKTTLTRLVKAEVVPVVTQLDGPNGALVFEAAEIERIRDERIRAKSGAQ